jgi:hypothetical protein
MFKLQHPQDLVSRLFILEYIKELGPNTIKEKLTDGEANFWLYKFEGEEKIEYDFNWEYLLFVIPLSNLSHIIERYLDEVEKIEEKRQREYNRYKEEHLKEELAKPVDINIYDIARADIKNQSNKLD